MDSMEGVLELENSMTLHLDGKFEILHYSKHTPPYVEYHCTKWVVDVRSTKCVGYRIWKWSIVGETPYLSNSIPTNLSAIFISYTLVAFNGCRSGLMKLSNMPVWSLWGKHSQCHLKSRTSERYYRLANPDSSVGNVLTCQDSGCGFESW